MSQHRTNNPATGIKGRALGRKAKGSIREHYEICPECGQAIDLRDLGEVFHHNEPGHKPLRVH